MSVRSLWRGFRFITGCANDYFTFYAIKLADVYAVIAYYFNHPEEVDEYVRSRQAAGQKLHREIEANQPQMAQIRERLLALKKAKHG